MCQASQTLRCNNVEMVGSLVSCWSHYFSILKEPVMELQLSFMLGEKYLNKIFLLFSGSESIEVSPN